MSLDEVRALTDDQLRVEIALAHGIKYRGAIGTDPARYVDAYVWLWPDWGFRPLPDWPRDLNACAASLWPEIEKRGLRCAFGACLTEVLDLSDYVSQGVLPAFAFCCARATARQHAEAALLALKEVAGV